MADDDVIKAKEPQPEVPIQHQKWTMYWSSLERYEKCPQMFLWSRGWGNIDVGGGPGKKKPLPERTSDHHRVMGKAIADVMEYLYNGTDEVKFPDTTDDGEKHPQAGENVPWWKLYQGAKLVDKLKEATQERFDYHADHHKTYIPYGLHTPKGQVPTRAQLLGTCLESVLNFLRTMKENKLLGKFAKAEVNLLGYIDPDNPIGGRVDLMFRRDDSGITILDGKNGKSKGKHTNPDQLRWYALCFYVAYGRLPDRLGFIYYRFPYDEADGETGVDWVEFDADDVKGLAYRAVKARQGMYSHSFDPVPAPKICRYCDYESICEARQAQIEKNRGRRKKKESEIKKDMASGSPIEGTGLSELDFG